MNKVMRCLILVLLMSVTALSQDEAYWSHLLNNLQIEAKAHKSAVQLHRIAETNPGARAFLERNLPSVIERSYQHRPDVWRESVRLAGDLRLTSCVDKLVQQVSAGGGGIITLSTWANLEQYPAGRALVQIGEPALEPLRVAMSEESDPRKRSIMIRAVVLIGTPTAKEVLRKHLQIEKDKELRKFIYKLLSAG